MPCWRGWPITHGLSLDELKACAYVHVDDQAVRHMMRVASGLDSLVLGEPQILGQMKSSYAVAREAGSIGPLLGRLFRRPSARPRPYARIRRSARTQFRSPSPP
ncbi:Glutamyl-tRNA reductase [Stutzerimonas stutzeri]